MLSENKNQIIWENGIQLLIRGGQVFWSTNLLYDYLRETWHQTVHEGLRGEVYVWWTRLTEHSFSDVWIHPESSDLTQQPVSLSDFLYSASTSFSRLSLRMHGANLAPILIKPAWKTKQNKALITAQVHQVVWLFSEITKMKEIETEPTRQNIFCLVLSLPIK